MAAALGFVGFASGVADVVGACAARLPFGFLFWRLSG